jgi:protoheme IX farnesyltransferase
VIPARSPLARDLLELTKPGIVRMCLLTTAGGLWLAPGELSLRTAAAALVGSGLAVAAANTFNMVWEHETDRLMQRTRRRPLAARRLPLGLAIAFGGVTTLVSWLVLILGTNPLTAMLALLALGSYVFVYTPLKFRTPLALLVGAVPGAVPPLLGWTAATDRIDLGGLVLFGVLLAWQMPHFLAIALHRRADYARAGIRCVPLVRGDLAARHQALAWSLVLVAVSITLVPLGLAGSIYGVVAAALGLGFVGWAATGLRPAVGAAWARGFFLASLVYLPALVGGLVLDRVIAAVW